MDTNTVAECGFCHRHAFLWGGDTCDQCDRDYNGIRDVNEPIGTGAINPHASLFPIEEKGWLIVSGQFTRSVYIGERMSRRLASLDPFGIPLPSAPRMFGCIIDNG